MEFEVTGTTMQALNLTLSEGESVYTEVGGMGWMSSNIEMSTNIKGGLFAGIKRKFSGESLFLTTYTAKNGAGTITFTSEVPGKIVPLTLGEGDTIICQKDAFLCASDKVELKIYLQKRLGAGLFGGEGFILQKVTGPGHVFLNIAGEMVEKELKPGEKIRIDPGHIAMYEPTVQQDISMVRGVRNILFGSEGVFLATLTGPGKVWLQSMPLRNLAEKLSKYIIPPRRRDGQ